MTSKQELEDLRNKIDWEGGLWTYVLDYGGGLPEELGLAAANLRSSAAFLENQLDALYKESGVEQL